MTIYLDTSAAVPLFVPEPASAGVVAWLESCTDTLVSSDWILTEFASALAIKVRRGELAHKHAKAAWEEFEIFSQTGLRLVPVTRAAFSRAAHLARNIRGSLRAGDSLHLAMAIETGAAGIATADGQLERSAGAEGMAVNRF
ncbi:MAG: VapC toxin family domain ribonuclease [Gammaproteobacteria bacterium]|nr:VapC toxin family domain ribonuclease [Gammaproteobacteria bacterium]